MVAMAFWVVARVLLCGSYSDLGGFKALLCGCYCGSRVLVMYVVAMIFFVCGC